MYMIHFNFKIYTKPYLFRSKLPLILCHTQNSKHIFVKNKKVLKDLSIFDIYKIFKNFKEN